MTKKEFGVFVAAMKTYYCREEKLIPNQAAFDLWFNALQDIPYPVAEAVLQKWVSTQKWSPSIAEIRAEAAQITTGAMPDWGDGWQEVETAIRRFGSYNVASAMASFTEITRKCVQRLGFLNLCQSENVTADRANFRNLYEQYARREAEARSIAPTLAENLRKLESLALQERLIGGGDD